ncbi:MAG TPA: flagellar hook-basal body complex protein FliE [Spirochaetia bacterium]|nr:flagellar hook-basal body complex protein FliE [Spirochaetia bacterium]
MLPSFFSTARIVKDPFQLSPLRTDVIDRLREREEQEKAELNPEQSFGDLLMKALNDVNTLQMEPYRLNEKMITEPNSVDIHDITLATAKANLSLSITKELIERTIRAYKEIINIR